MTPDSVLHELDNFLTLLSQSQVAILTTKVIKQQRAAGVRRVTWATNATVSGSLFRHSSATVAEYREWLNAQGYSAVLYDGSIIQLSYDFRFSELIGHRLLYFPCPFDIDQELLVELGLIDAIDLYESENAESIRLRSPVRFDYDRDARSYRHPVSHMTFQWSKSRIPVVAPISLGDFIQFVFKNFYPDMWQVHSFMQQWPRERIAPTITLDEQRELHLSVLTRN